MKKYIIIIIFLCSYASIFAKNDIEKSLDDNILLKELEQEVDNKAQKFITSGYDNYNTNYLK